MPFSYFPYFSTNTIHHNQRRRTKIMKVRRARAQLYQEKLGACWKSVDYLPSLDASGSTVPTKIQGLEAHTHAVRTFHHRSTHFDVHVIWCMGVMSGGSSHQKQNAHTVTEQPVPFDETGQNFPPYSASMVSLARSKSLSSSGLRSGCGPCSSVTDC